MQMMTVTARVLLVIALQLSTILALADSHIEDDRQSIAQHSLVWDISQSLSATSIADASATRYEKKQRIKNASYACALTHYASAATNDAFDQTHTEFSLLVHQESPIMHHHETNLGWNGKEKR